MSKVNCRWLGRISFEEGLRMQEEIIAQKAGDSSLPDEVLLLEHDPVFTIGRTLDKSSLRDPSQLPAPLVITGRGGQATWHGPGQLVGYPLLDLRTRGQDLHRHLRSIEDVLIELCAKFSVNAGRREGLTGVWVEDRKLASIGVGVRKWISMHGFALNVCGELDGFAHITPCGIAGVAMTSLSREAGRELGVREVADAFATLAGLL